MNEGGTHGYNICAELMGLDSMFTVDKSDTAKTLRALISSSNIVHEC